MGAVGGLGRRLGHNAALAMRRLAARAATARGAGAPPIWLLVRVGARQPETRPGPVWLSREPRALAFVDLPGHGLSTHDTMPITEGATAVATLGGTGTYVGYSMVDVEIPDAELEFVVPAGARVVVP